MPSKRITIVGGGLTGLTLAYLLSKQDIDLTIVEASSRLGGRIQTIVGEKRDTIRIGSNMVFRCAPKFITIIRTIGIAKISSICYR